MEKIQLFKMEKSNLSKRRNPILQDKKSIRKKERKTAKKSKENKEKNLLIKEIFTPKKEKMIRKKHRPKIFLKGARK